MAQLVCISDDTCRPDINEVGDVVSVHDDDVELTGPGYAAFDVIQIDGLTAAEVISDMSDIAYD